MTDFIPAILTFIAFAALICGFINHFTTWRSQRRDQANNPLRGYSDHEIVRQHSNSGANSHFLSEMVRRLMTNAQHLSEWMFWFTVVACTLAALSAWIGWKTFTMPLAARPPLLDSL